MAVLCAIVGVASTSRGASEDRRPNVIVIVTDDQGYGDFGATGNPVFETPNIDRLAAKSTSFGHFYVSPLCAPTRASLMTGRYNYRTGVVDTYLGRSLMSADEVTIAEVLAGAGYETGIFGKWHLGDNYPRRAMDQGFKESLVIRGGGLGQASDPRENHGRYTNPILFHNGKQIETRGYCTDVYFDAAMAFMRKARKSGQSFFAYIATNTAHYPLDDVPANLLERYRKKDVSGAFTRLNSNSGMDAELDSLRRLGAMSTNIDDNVGRLVAELKRLEIDRDTILVFLTDNGPNTYRFVSGMRGMKGSVYEAGVRSPLWISWPGHLPAGQTCEQVAAHIDLMPTILDACRVSPSPPVHFDGRSLLPLLEDSKANWADREIVIQSNRADTPQRFENFMIRNSRWKLVNADSIYGDVADKKRRFELYDIRRDPAEKNDVAADHPDVVAGLKAKYEEWFDDVTQRYTKDYHSPLIQVGTPHENPTVLTRQCWRDGTWDPDSKGYWDVHVESPGTYDVTLLFDANNVAETAALQIGDVSAQARVPAGATSCGLAALKLPAGDFQLVPTLQSPSLTRGVYQVVVERK